MTTSTRTLNSQRRENSALAQHKRLTDDIRVKFNQRHKDPAAIGEVIDMCERMIRLAPNVLHELFTEHRDTAREFLLRGHPGYERLISIRRRHGLHGEAARLQLEYADVWRDLAHPTREQVRHALQERGTT